MPLAKDHLFFGLAKRMTGEQREFVNAIMDKQFIATNSPSGTGKTTMAVATAKLLNQPLYFIMSPTQEKELGFRPGKTGEKISDYMTPLYDALLEIGEDPNKVVYNEEDLNNQKAGNVWVYPMVHTFARGRNLRGTIILDEAQNYTRSELKKTLTRIHDYFDISKGQQSKVIMIGHSDQCDLPDPRKSGFIPYIEHFQNEPYFKQVDLTTNFRGKIAQKADELRW